VPHKRSSLPVMAIEPTLQAERDPALVENASAASKRDEMIDGALADSFPASDPPPWTLGTSRPGSSGRLAAKATNGIASSLGSPRIHSP
jgi:hypothetical protein